MQKHSGYRATQAALTAYKGTLVFADEINAGYLFEEPFRIYNMFNWAMITPEYGRETNRFDDLIWYFTQDNKTYDFIIVLDSPALVVEGSQLEIALNKDFDIRPVLIGDLTDLERYGYLNPAAYARFPFEQDIDYDRIVGWTVFGLAVTFCVVCVIFIIVKNLNLKCVNPQKEQ